MASRPMGVESLSNGKHGTKRRAEDDLGEQQRLTKRFNLLNLEHQGKLWIAPPIANAHHHSYPPPSSSHHHHHHHHDQPPPSSPPTPLNTTHNHPPNDHMHLDSTKDKIYIHDLDAELADIESSETQTPLIFIPDIERHLNQLPEHLLRGGGAPGHQRQGPSGGGELVLYSVPSSLSVPEEQDSVRRAILEARARAREKQEQGQGSLSSAGAPATAEMDLEPSSSVVDAAAHGHDTDDDGDAMDLE